MRVLMLTTSYPRFENDTAAPFIAGFAEGMARLGHSIDVVLPYHPQLQVGIRHGVSLHPFHVPGDRRKPLWGYAQSMDGDVKLKKSVLWLAPFALHRCYQKAMSLLWWQRYDLIHAHWVLPNGFIGRKVAAKKKLPLVVSLHGSDMFLVRKNPVFRRFAVPVLKEASVVTACSPDLQKQAEEVSNREVLLLEYGVDINHFSPAPVAREPNSILAVGRLVWKKGFSLLIDSFRAVVKYYNSSTLNIVGSGPMMDELQKQSFDLRGAVRFAGNINRDSLPEYYRKAEIVVVPSVTDASGNRDGLPNVFLEALASGCAVVASDIPGIKNVVQSGKEAVIVPSGDPDSLAGAILDLLGNAERREELRREARKRAVESYSWEVKSRLLESVYQKVL